MGATKEMWIAEHERICEFYASGEITRSQAEAMLRGLGFDRIEIADELDALDEDRENT